MVLKPLNFISEAIDVEFDIPPSLEKKPGCPSRFIWRGSNYIVEVLLSEWADYHRKGRMARNMIPTHSTTAERRGSWGVGVFYYQVRTINLETCSRHIFEIYYDRSPKDSDHRKGAWFLYQELIEEEN
jgi:hypothetical protein